MSTVETSSGRIRGRVDRGVHSFKGLPYATARRFMAPDTPVPWTGVRDSFELGPRSPQPGYASPPSDVDRLLSGGNREPISEDCQVLNVWTAGCDGARRPVMVWLHGGGFSGSAANRPMYDGTAVASKQDVVVVTLNHRLGVVGYLHLGDVLGEEYASSGLAGMLDLVAALEWVRENISSFGGDPGNVTIFGESGGGMKVGTLMGMPSAKGLFHKAIVQSGPALRGATREDASRAAERVLARLDGNPREAPWERLVDAAATANLRPVVDGKLLPEHPFDPVATPLARDVPLMIGTCADESALFLYGQPGFADLTLEDVRERLGPQTGILDAYRKARPDASPCELLVAVQSDAMFGIGSVELADRKVAGGGAPVFMYLFTYVTEALGTFRGAPHAVELPFVFDTVDSAPIAGDGPHRHELAAQVSAAWAAFARTGDPNHDGIASWPAYDSATRPTMLLDHPCRVENDPRAALREAWRSVRATA